MKKLIYVLSFIAATNIIMAQNLDKADKDFVMEAADAGLMEVKLGQLAMTNGESDEVKTLGKHMIDDHSKANNELKALASKKAVTLPETLTADAQKTYDDLSKKKGADFDKEYAHLMVKDHKKVIGKFKHEAEKGTDADLKSWASKTLPTLEHHLEMSEKACKDKKK